MIFLRQLEQRNYASEVEIYKRIWGELGLHNFAFASDLESTEIRKVLVVCRLL